MKLTTAELNKMNLEEVSPGVYRSRNAGITPRFTKEKDIVSRAVEQTEDFQYSIKTEWFIQGYSVPSKKNSRQNFVRNGKQISIPSKKHAEYVKMTAMQYSVFGKEFRAAVKAYDLKYPLRIEFTFIRSTKHRFDYCNSAQSVEDLMVSNKWIEDDSADHIIPVFAPYKYDKNNPGVVIRLITK